MKSKTFLIAASLAIGFIGFGVSWSKARFAREAEASRAAFAQRRARTAKEIQTLEERLAAIKKDRAAFQAVLDGSEKANVLTATELTPKNASSDGGPFNPREAILKDPKLQNLYLGWQRANLAKNYGPFFQQRGLTSAQITKFEDILMAREEQKMDLQAVAQSQGLRPDSPTLTSMRKQTEKEILAAQTALLDPAGVDQLQQYERTAELRTVVGKFAGAAVLEAVPLTARQAEQVTQIMADANSSYSSGGKANLPDINWTAADAKLAGVLSADQLSLFQQIEPMGGGPSRFMARFSASFQQAVKAERRNAPTPVNKPPGG